MRTRSLQDGQLADDHPLDARSFFNPGHDLQH
jgi:hypothetical protein